MNRANLSEASLNEANLSRAYLSTTYLSETSLSGVNLSKAELHKASLGHIDMSRANLSQANLSRANLSEANLSEANLSEANLNGADLSGAELMGANLLKADLRDACLYMTQVLDTSFREAWFTGACLKDWNTNRVTILEGAKADYVYLDLKDSNFSCRCPHSSNFEPGEFATLFQHALDTLDLIFRDGIDWQAFFTSFQNLRQGNYDASLNIQAIEKRGSSFVVRLEMSEETDKATIEQAAKVSYERQLQLLEARHQAQFQSQDAEHQREIAQLHRESSTNMLEITRMVASKPSSQFTQHNYGDSTGIQSDIDGGTTYQGQTIDIDTPEDDVFPSEESQLLGQISQGVPVDLQAQYDILRAKRETETLTEDEQGQLIELSKRIEQFGADRLKAMVNLAQLRQVSLTELMDSLGIQPVGYE